MTNQTNAPAATQTETTTPATPATSAKKVWYKNRTTKLVGGALVIGGLGIIAEKKFGLGTKLMETISGSASTAAETASAVVGFFRK